MSRKFENWKMILEPQASLVLNHLVGKVKYEDEFERFIIDILWDDKSVISERSTLLVTSNKNKNSILIIYVANNYVRLLSEKEYALAGLWHEIGHIHYGHFDFDHFDQEEMRRGRYEALLKGSVYYPEAEADSFATKCVGKNRMVQFLQFCKANRLKVNDANSELAIKEFDARINLVKRLVL